MYRSLLRGGALTLAVAFQLIAAPGSAAACPCVAELGSTLRDARDVPLDVAPVIDGFAYESSITFRALNGTPVPFTVRAGEAADCESRVGELLPRGQLAPFTTYVIGAELLDGTREELRFTTGATLTPVAPLSVARPTVTLLRDIVADSCTSAVTGCLDLGAVETEVRVRDALGAELQWFIARGALPLSRVLGEPACLEVRARDAAGRRSEPLTLCGSELALRDAVLSDYDGSRLRCEAGAIAPPQFDPTQPIDGGISTSSSAEPAFGPDVDFVPVGDAGAGDARAPGLDEGLAEDTNAASGSWPSSDEGCALAPGTREHSLGLLALLLVVRNTRRPRASRRQR